MNCVIYETKVNAILDLLVSGKAWNTIKLYINCELSALSNYVVIKVDRNIGFMVFCNVGYGQNKTYLGELEREWINSERKRSYHNCVSIYMLLF